MKEKRRFTSGFTLVEFLIYFGLVSILFVVMTELFISLLDLKSKSQSMSSVAIDAQYLPVRLETDILKADSIVTPASLGATTAQLQMIIEGQTITYSIQADRLVRTSSAGTQRVLGDTLISQLQFQRLGNVGGKHSLKISYTLTSPVQMSSGSDFIEYETTLGLR